MSTDRNDRQTSVDELPAAITQNNFSPQVAELYERMFINLRREAQARPGMTTLQLMVAERTAHTYARLKSYDTQESVYAPDLDKATRAFNSMVQRLIDSAERDDDDETYRRLAASSLVGAVSNAVEDAIENGDLTELGAAALLSGFEKHITAAMD